MKGKTPFDLEEPLSKFLSTVIEPMINIYALRLLHNHHHDNDIMLLASATNSVLVEPIARRLGFENIVATEVEIIDGVYTGKVYGRPALGQGKLTKVEEWAAQNNIKDFKDAIFYSDSINDLPLLSEVGVPIAVNPDDQLRNLSIKNNWEVIDLP